MAQRSVFGVKRNISAIKTASPERQGIRIGAKINLPTSTNLQLVSSLPILLESLDSKV